MIHVICSRCSARFTTSDANAGKTGQCPKCGNALRIPPVGTAPPPPSAAAPRPAPHPQAAPPQPAPQAAPPAAAEPATQPAGPAVGLGQAFRWIGEGIARGLGNFLPLAVAVLAVTVLVTLSWAICVVPGVFLEPPLVAGLVLVLLGAARGERGLLGRLFAGFSEGRYWPSMGAVWLLGLIFTLISVPISIAVTFLGASSLMLILSHGTIGLVVLAIGIPVVYSPVLYLSSRLAWVLPLVVERRAKVVESLTVSWRLTGRVAHGFGLFVQMLALALVSLVGQAVILGLALAVFGAGGLAAFSASAPGLLDYEQARGETSAMPARPGETPDEHYERQVRELHRRVGTPMPPRAPVEADRAYCARAASELEKRMTQEAASAAGTMAAAGIAGLAVAGLLATVLGAALGAILAMPVMVGYRDVVGRRPT